MTDEYEVEQIENGYMLTLDTVHATLGTPHERKLFFETKVEAIQYLINELKAQIGDKS